MLPLVRNCDVRKQRITRNLESHASVLNSAPMRNADLLPRRAQKRRYGRLPCTVSTVLLLSGFKLNWTVPTDFRRTPRPIENPLLHADRQTQMAHYSETCLWTHLQGTAETTVLSKLAILAEEPPLTQWHVQLASCHAASALDADLLCASQWQHTAAYTQNSRSSPRDISGIRKDTAVACWGRRVSVDKFVLCQLETGCNRSSAEEDDDSVCCENDLQAGREFT